jgi:3'-phosphoadenosine 5'-phosphosulfate sulfotransferase (PAPS reductase)/FAD synthetase
MTPNPQRQTAAEELIARAKSRIEEAIQEWKPVAVYGMFSGGHDSLTATYIASLVDGFTAAAHINTGIGVPQTREFVIETCRKRGWLLKHYKAIENTTAKGLPDPQVYAELVRRFGFPGPGGHGLMYVRLKERQIRRLVRDSKKNRKDKVMLIAGCRSQESARRMRNTEPVQKDGARIWVNPIHDFSKTECGRVIAFAGLDRSPVVDRIHKSGECLCGAFAQPGELEELRMWYPEVAAEIEALQAEVEPKFGWGWEGKPKCSKKQNGSNTQLAMPLCHNCLIGQSLEPLAAQPPQSPITPEEV